MEFMAGFRRNFTTWANRHPSAKQAGKWTRMINISRHGQFGHRLTNKRTDGLTDDEEQEWCCHTQMRTNRNDYQEDDTHARTNKPKPRDRPTDNSNQLTTEIISSDMEIASRQRTNPYFMGDGFIWISKVLKKGLTFGNDGHYALAGHWTLDLA